MKTTPCLIALLALTACSRAAPEMDAGAPARADTAGMETEPMRDAHAAQPEPHPAATAGAADPAVAAVPPALRTALGGTLLAAKPLDPGAAGDVAWVAVHRDAQDASRCEVVLLKEAAGAFEAVARNDKVVDCLYNELARNADDLNANLDAAGDRFTYTNQRDKGYAAYTFAYFADRKGWFLVEALTTAPAYDEASDAMEVYREQIEDPQAREAISFAGFDPEAIRAQLKQSRTRVE